MAKAKKSESSEKEARGLKIGVNSGVGVTATWNVIFKANLKAHKHDDELLKMMQKEFPHRDYFQPVGRCRSWYNTGKFGFGVLGADVKAEGKDWLPKFDKEGNIIRSEFNKKDEETPAAKKPTAKKGEAAKKPAKKKVVARKD